MSMPVKNIIVSIVLLFFGAWFMYLSSELPVRNIQNVPGPAFFPGIMSVIIILLSLALLLRGVLGLRSLPAFTEKIEIPRKGFLLTVLFLAVVLVLPYSGFLIAAIPFFAALMFLCENTKLVYVLLGSVIIPAFLYYLFREGFSILLPAGQWI